MYIIAFPLVPLSCIGNQWFKYGIARPTAEVPLLDPDSVPLPSARLV